ncbi:hypothetical protein EV137_2292 [Kribbella pratensis]|uniref:Nuclear transport factor 2 family protein n=1 Tax=Kribbella pratensis TaxID=2512112 RepID=A0ABY2FQB6_9ACTN|nr:hypothetical protein [Kribbella pratensis]TDW94964.1 hypothetical protein EV137_2292 [Kribbella pratensis]
MQFTIKHLVGVAVVAATAAAPLAPAAAGHSDRRCAQRFDAAQRQDMESFRDFKADEWRAVHDTEAISIDPSGKAAYGIEQIMAGAKTHFERKWAIWSWTELSRRVDGCRTAVIVYDATYDIPSIDYHQRALTTVTYTYKHGHWLGVLDQGTYLDAPS